MPPELYDYLGKENRKWDIGEEYLPYATLYTAEDAPEITCTIRGPNYFGECPAIDLVCDVGPHYFSPVGALVWVPKLSEYGYWNDAQHILLLHPGITLSDILDDPVTYLMHYGLSSGRAFPYYLKPWCAEYPDDERCRSLVCCARQLRTSAFTFPRALKSALLAAEPELNVSPMMRRVVDYLAGQLINDLVDRKDIGDIKQICDSMLGTISIAPKPAMRLEAAAARQDFKTGNLSAGINRYELVLANDFYREYHEWFRERLHRLKERMQPDNEPRDGPESSNPPFDNG